MYAVNYFQTSKNKTRHSGNFGINLTLIRINTKNVYWDIISSSESYRNSSTLVHVFIFSLTETSQMCNLAHSDSLLPTANI